MITTSEIARGIYRISTLNDPSLEGISFPDSTYNMFLVAADKPVIINTMYRRTFPALRAKIAEILDPASLRYIVVPHHEGDSSGAINEWLAAAPRAETLCSELCAMLSLRDFADKEPIIVSDGQVVDLGSHRLRFVMTPQVNQWDSLMAFEESTGTLFSNDLFSMPGIEETSDREMGDECIKATYEVGYQPDDRTRLLECLDKIEPLPIRLIAVMHGPVIKGHFKELFRAFRSRPLHG